MQVKLLRVLQQQSFQRVGGSETVCVDVRVLAATHCGLETMIREGKFREDLFHRLNVVTLHLPPLRERRDDIPVLVRHFLWKYAADFGIEAPAITPDALAQLQANPWPGNIRELENVSRRLLLDARGLAIDEDAVRRTLSVGGAGPAQLVTTLPALAGDFLARAQRGELNDAYARLLAEAEREILTQAIALAAGNQAQASRWLGISRLTLREKLTHLGLRPRQQDDEVR
jgi:DNA-binding NtrC family response regulator